MTRENCFSIGFWANLSSILFIVQIVLSQLAQARNYKQCGEPNGIPFRTGYVKGGQLAQPQAWPWVVSIRLRNDRGQHHSGKHICAGTLVSPRFVLTAGHCMLKRDRSKRKSNELFVATGSHKIFQRATHEEWITVKNIYLHPRYRAPNIRTWAYDLALIELRNPSIYQDAARPACLPTESPKDKDKCVVVGWGRTDNARESYELRQAFVPVVSRTECNKRNFWSNYIDQTMICAGYIDQRYSGKYSRSACQGDSGGPLVCEQSQNHWTVSGIVSWGPVVCGDKPSVYTNIALYSMRSWIRKTLEKAGEKLGKAKTTPARFRHATPPTPKNNTPPPLPCGSITFERVPSLIVYGRNSYVMRDVSSSQCVYSCCKRGERQCGSFLYYPKRRECRLSKASRCDHRHHTVNRYTTDVIYYGRKCG